MTPEQWERSKAIFGAATEMEIGLREAYVRKASGGDMELFGEVMSLLYIDASAQTLRNPAFDSRSSERVEAPPHAKSQATAPTPPSGLESFVFRFKPLLEREYAADYFRRSLTQVRAALLLAIT